MIAGDTQCFQRDARGIPATEAVASAFRERSLPLTAGSRYVLTFPSRVSARRLLTALPAPTWRPSIAWAAECPLRKPDREPDPTRRESSSSAAINAKPRLVAALSLV